MLHIEFCLLNTFKHRLCMWTLKNLFHSMSWTDLCLKSNTKKFAILQTNPMISKTFLQTSNYSSSQEVRKLTNIILVKSKPNDNKSEDKAELVKVLKFLLSKGCTSQDIKEKCIKYINSQNNSYFKAVLISELDPDMPTLLPLMSLSLSALRKAAMQARGDKSEIEGFPNRIAYLSHHLEKSPSDLMPALAKHSSMITMPFQRLERKMNILKNGNISPEYIVKDLWIFNYNENLLARRISAAVGAGVELKPWMLRCSENIYESMLLKYSAAKKILGEDDDISYLAKKLECKEEYVAYIMQKNKLLKAINIPKLEQVLNFLYEKGYTPQEVRLFPRVFCSSVQTLSKRFDDAIKIRNSLPTISQLCMSSKKFKQKIEQHIKSAE